VTLSISPEFVDFLAGLSRKQKGEPFCFYQSSIDFLIVICGDGHCSDWSRLVVGPMIFQGVDVIQKGYLEDRDPLADKFAGIKIWGGIQGFLSKNYQQFLGEKYGAYRLLHNTNERTTPIAEIINLLRQDGRYLTLPAWSDWGDRVVRALTMYRPKVHIPLISV
jgi:hypothetical protein